MAADETKILEYNGKVSAINPTERKLTMKDIRDAPQFFTWTEPLDVVMKKWKEGYYLHLTYNPDTYVLKNAEYWKEGKDEWVKAHPQQGGYKGTPRNNKVILFERLLESAVELRKLQGPVRADLPLKTLLKECVDAANDNLADACKHTGVQ